jgi:hypothetical protein
MAANEETTLEETVNTTEESEKETLAIPSENTAIAHLKSKFCFFSDPPNFCIPFHNAEQLGNPLFETGDFTDWVLEGEGAEAKYMVTDVTSHSGVYCVKMLADPNTGIAQTFTNPIPLECIALAGFWGRNLDGLHPTSISAITYFDDDTWNATYLYLDWYDTDWHYKSLLEILDPLLFKDKRLKKLKFFCMGTSCYFDDTTVKGKSV